jgi:hypothetical protein
MSQRLVQPFVVMGICLLIVVPGCMWGLISPSSVQVPAALQYVLDHVDAFRTDEPAQESDMGPAVADAGELDGCWGAALVDTEAFPPVALFLVYRFNSADGTYCSWSALGQPSGQLAPLAPLVTEESGVFVVEADGVIRTTIQQIRANVDVETGRLTTTLQVQPTPTESVERTLQGGLDGDELILRYEADDPDKPEFDGDLLLFRRFDCPAEQ